MNQLWELIFLMDVHIVTNGSQITQFLPKLNSLNHMI